MNKKKTAHNILFGFLTQLIIIGLGLVLPRLVLVSYGSDTNGFTSTVTQIFTWMALMEAGIAQSTLNSLYDPVARGDRDEISRKMSASRRYYRKVTWYYGLIVLAMSLLMPRVIHTQIEKTTATIYFLLTGMSSVIGFYFLESWKQLLSADGKYYVSQIAGMITTICGYVVKIILVPLAIKITWIQFAYFLIALAQLLIYKLYFRKHYAWVDFSAEPDESALKDRSSFMLNQIATTVFTSTDTIVLSIVGSTLLSSVYAIYSLIFHNLVKILDAVYFGTVFNLGQTWRRDKTLYPRVHDVFDTLTHWAITSTMSVAYLLTIPFVKLYTRGVTDVNYVYKWLPLLFALVQILSYNRYVNGNLTALAGYAKTVSRISVIEACANVIGSVFLGIKFGLYGVLAATVLALPLKVVYCMYIANKKVMERSIWNSLKIILTNYALLFLVVLFSAIHPIEAFNFGEFILYGFICCVIIYPVFFAINTALNFSVMKSFVVKTAGSMKSKIRR